MKIKILALKMRFLTIFLVLVVIFNVVNSYKIFIFFPYPGKSHSILGEGFVRHLVQGGHNITYVTAIPLKNPPPNVRQIDVSSNYKSLKSTEKELDIEKILKKESKFMDLSLGFEIMFNVSYDAVTHENVQRLLMDPTEQFDVAIVEWIYTDLYSGLAPVFGCPLIWSSSMEPHPFVMSLIGDIPNPAYSPNQMSSWTPPLTFVQRVQELGMVIVYAVAFTWYLKGYYESTYVEVFGPAFQIRGREIPVYEDVLYNASIMFGNSHVSQGFALSLPQNYVPIAGYHINDEVAPLPKNLQKILDNAEHGVIYFSLGSMVPGKTMPDELKKGLLKTFSKLRQNVIWKLESPLNDVPSNVHIVDWAPQQSILAHPNTIIFISHGGLLSTTEAIHFGVPIIGIPIFGDQFVNIARAVAKGIGLNVDIAYDMPDKLENAIREILGNSSYRERVKEVSLLFHSRPMKPGQLINYWVNHVVQTKGAKYLRTLGLDVPMYQKLYLDFIAVLTLSSILLYYSIKWLVKKVIEKLKRKLCEKKKIS